MGSGTNQTTPGKFKKADIAIVLFDGNNYPSSGRPLPHDIFDSLVDLVTMGVRAARICELVPRYPYNCTMDDVVAKEEIDHIEHVTRSLCAKLAKRCQKANLGQGT